MRQSPARGQALSLATVAYALAQCVGDRATHPSIAMAMMRQGRFAGFRVRPAADRRLDVGGAPIAAALLPASTSIQCPFSVPVPTTAQSFVAPAEDPGWLRYDVRPAALFDVVISELFAGQVEFRHDDVKHASFAVPSAQRDVVDQIVAKVAKSKPSGP